MVDMRVLVRISVLGRGKEGAEGCKAVVWRKSFQGWTSRSLRGINVSWKGRNYRERGR